MRPNRDRQRQPVRSGALTIVITLVMLLLAVLALLALVTAHADSILADRQAGYAQENAMAEEAGQEWFAEMDDFIRGDGGLPDGTRQDGDSFSAEVPFAENSILSIRAFVDFSGKDPVLKVTKWTVRTSRQETEAESSGEETLYETGNFLPETMGEGEGIS